MKIASAAIRYKGKIYTGANHAAIGLKMVRDGVCPAPYPHGDDQGFTTDCDKYVRRTPALMIAIRSGQVEGGKTLNSRQLYSEDLKESDK